MFKTSGNTFGKEANNSAENLLIDESVSHKNVAGNTKARWNFNGRHFAIGDMKGDISINKLRAADIEYDEENLVEFMNLITDLSHGRGKFVDFFYGLKKIRGYEPTWNEHAVI